VPIHSEANPHNAKYLETKRTKMGHLLWFGAADFGLLQDRQGASDGRRIRSRES